MGDKAAQPYLLPQSAGGRDANRSLWPSPLHYTSFPGSQPPLLQGTPALCECLQPLQARGRKPQDGEPSAEVLGRLAVPGVANIRRVKGNMLLASHHGCEVPLEALFKQPFMSFQRGGRRPNLCGQETGFDRVRKRSSCLSHQPSAPAGLGPCSRKLCWLLPRACLQQPARPSCQHTRGSWGAPGENTVVMHRLLRRANLALERGGSRWRPVIGKCLEKSWELLRVRKADMGSYLRQEKI